MQKNLTRIAADVEPLKAQLKLIEKKM